MSEQNETAKKETSVRQTGLNVIRKLSEQKELQELLDIQEQLRYFEKRFQDEEFRIAVVGEFSSGKSTFINALIGQDVLQHALKETTATLTRLVNVAEDDPRNGKGCVTLRSGKRIELNDWNELRDYTTTTSSKLDVAAEVEQTELYLPMFRTSHPVVVVDTPGLNGLADGHREKTEALIQQAHACIYLIQRRGLSESDLHTLQMLVRIQKNFIFVQNFIDTLKTDEGETLEKKLEEQQAILQEKVFAQAEDAQYSLCGVSAWQALVGRDHGIRTLYADDTELIPEQQRAEMYKASNFQQFLQLLQELIREDRLAQVQYGGTAQAMIGWLDRLSRRMDLQIGQRNKAYELSLDGRMAKRLEERIRKVQEGRQRAEDQMKNFVTALHSQLRKDEKEALKERFAALCREMVEKIQNYGNNMDCIAAAQGIGLWQKDLSGNLSARLYEVFRQEQEALFCREDNNDQLLRDRINEYRDPEAEELKLELDHRAFGVDRLDLDPFNAKDKLKEDEERIREDEDTLQNLTREISRTSTESVRKQTDARLAEISYRNKQEITEYKRQQLGPCPEPEEIRETKLVYRGGLLGWMLPPKKVESVTLDDSARKVWDEKRADWERCSREEEELEQKARALWSEATRLQMKLQNDKEARQRREKRLAERKEKLKADRALLEKEKTAAADAYLHGSQKKLIEQVEEYLSQTDDGYPWYTMWCALEEQIGKTEEEYMRVALRQLDKAICDKVEWLEAARNGKHSELKQQTETLEKYNGLLGELKREMEEQIA